MGSFSMSRPIFLQYWQSLDITCKISQLTNNCVIYAMFLQIVHNSKALHFGTGIACELIIYSN